MLFLPYVLYDNVLYMIIFISKLNSKKKTKRINIKKRKEKKEKESKEKSNLSVKEQAKRSNYINLVSYLT